VAPAPEPTRRALARLFGGGAMSGLLIGYARVSTEEQDLTAQRDGLAHLGVEPSCRHRLKTDPVSAFEN